MPARSERDKGRFHALFVHVLRDSRRGSSRPIDGFIFVRRSRRRCRFALSLRCWRRGGHSVSSARTARGSEIVPKYRSEQIMSRVTNALACCLPRRLATSERANKLATTAIRLRRLARAAHTGVFARRGSLSLSLRERERVNARF